MQTREQKNLYEQFKNAEPRALARLRKKEPQYFERRFGVTLPNSEKRKKEIKDFYEKNGRLPSQQSRDPLEKKLAQGLSSYTKLNSQCYDAKFRKWYESVKPNKSETKKQAIKEFYSKHKKLPSIRSKDTEEKILAKALNRYTAKTNNCFDPEFRKWYESVKRNKSETKKQAIKEFYSKHKKLPSIRSKDTEEKILAKALNSYTSKTGRCFDPEFRKWYESVKPNKSETKKRAIKDFYVKNGRLPSKYSINEKERKLGRSRASYVQTGSDCFDPEFRKWCELVKEKIKIKRKK